MQEQKLVVVTNDGVDIKPLRPALESLIANQDKVLIEFKSPSQLQSLQSVEVGTVNWLFLYEDLAEVLYRKLMQSPQSDTDKIVQTWVQDTQLLQDGYWAYSQSALLLNAHDACNDLSAFLQACSDKWGLVSVGSGFSVDTPERKSASTLFQWIAQELVTQDQTLKQKVNYLQALTWPLQSNTQQPQLSAQDLLDTLKKLYVGQQQLEHQAQELNQALSLQLKQKEENESILGSLFKTQEELERILLQEKKLIEQKQELEKQLQQSQRSREAVDGQLAKLQGELDLSKTEKEKSQKEVNQLKEQVATLNRKNQLEQEDLKKENEMILDNLFKTQEELERFFIKEKSAKEQVEKSQKALEQSEKQQHELRKQIERYNAEALKTRKESLLEKESLEKENQELLEKVLSLQEELSSYRLKESTLEPSSKATGRTNVLTSFQEKSAKRKALRRDKERAEFIAKSNLFDVRWYLEQYPDVAEDKIQSRNPALHYLRIGGFEGRNPSPRFDSAFYLESNPDVAQMKMNPLWHYLQHGQMESRRSIPE